jgi:MFS family permease
MSAVELDQDAAGRIGADERGRAAASAAPADAPWPSPSRGWWAVGVLTFAYIVSFVDRSILSLLIEPIKADLHLTDTQIAAVQGIAFAIFYSVMGLPLGWLADRYSRRAIIAVGALVWCLATAASGLAGGFLALFLARLAVGAGEAALSPAAMSMISDLFPPAKRGPPIGVYSMSAALGSGLALILGGAVIAFVSTAESVTLPFLGAVRPWQATFIVVGAMGLVLLPLLASIREPVRRVTARERAAPQSGMLPFLRQHVAFYGRHYAGVAVFSALAYAILSWTPAMFIRVHGMTAPEVGLQYGIVLLVFGGLGPVTGGWLAARLYRRNVPAASVKIVTVSILALIPCTVLAGIAETPTAALLALVPASVLLTAPMGTALLAVQEVTPNRLRGQMSALYYVFSSIVGLSVGPLAVAIFTDHVYGDPKSVGVAIAIVAGIFGPLAAFLVYGGRHEYAVLARAIADDAARDGHDAR